MANSLSISALGDSLDGEVVVSGDAIRAARTDRSGYIAPGEPAAVVLAESVEDVQKVMRFAAEAGLRVVPRGAGTGLAGGAATGAGEISLDLSRMNRILSVDVADESAVVQPGILNDELNTALAEYGLWWSPDPASKAISSVGGNIATNAGGLLCAKYGVTRESVLALQVVLADGSVLRTGHRTVKGVTGYDLTALMIGSEGTLGVIVEATLKLRPMRKGEPATLSAVFPDIVSAAAASAAVTASGAKCAALELLDRACVECIEKHLGHPITEGGGAYLLVQTDGPAAAEEADALLEILRAHGGTVAIAHGFAEGEELMSVRRAMLPALDALGTVLIEDVAVPRSRLPEMFAAIEAIAEKYRVPIPVVAHAGDGNLHPNFILPRDAEAVPDEIWQAAGEIFTTAIALDGTLTGEHGVGVLKRRWIADELGETAMRISYGIKDLFDPKGILSPGRMLPTR